LRRHVRNWRKLSRRRKLPRGAGRGDLPQAVVSQVALDDLIGAGEQAESMEGVWPIGPNAVIDDNITFARAS
jgi:hypothetical protein